MPTERAVVIQPVINLFSKPSTDADVVSQAICSTAVTVLEHSAGWARIQTPDEYTGWVEDTELSPLSPPGSYPRTGHGVTVESLRAHIYREPSVTKHEPLITLPFETRLELVAGSADAAPTDEPRRWLRVRLPDGRNGWVQRGDVTDQLPTLTIALLDAFSRRFLGLPYTWGGASSFGYDCSGFTQMLCRRGGVSIPRDAQPQADWSSMMKVERADLQPGDLLYFGKSERKITHCGYYLGAGKFIHSTAFGHPVVQISSLADEHWTTLLVACRRWKH